MTDFDCFRRRAQMQNERAKIEAMMANQFSACAIIGADHRSKMQFNRSVQDLSAADKVIIVHKW